MKINEAIEVLRDPLEYGLRHNFKHTYNEASEMIIKMLQWVPIEEYWPTEEDWFPVGHLDQFCLLTLTNNNEPDVMYSTHIEWFDLDYCKDQGITHWARLPGR